MCVSEKGNGRAQVSKNRGVDGKDANRAKRVARKDGKTSEKVFTVLFNLTNRLLSIAPPAQCPANEERSSSSGVILSPGFPSNYPNSQTCSWLLHMVPGTVKIIVCIFLVLVLSVCDCKLYSLRDSLSTIDCMYSVWKC